MLFRTKYTRSPPSNMKTQELFHMQSNCSEQDMLWLFVFVVCVEVFTPINYHAQTYIVLTYSHASRWITLGPTFNFFSSSLSGPYYAHI